MLKKSLKAVGKLTSALALIAGLGVSQSAVAQDALLGEIKMVGFNFAPRGYAKCDGQLISITSNAALFSLLGNTFGGDGRTTFALPDLRGRVAIHSGRGNGLLDYRMGQRGGVEFNYMTTAQMPSHSHGAVTTVTEITATLKGTNASGNSTTPADSSLASQRRTNIYSADTPDVDLHAGSIVATATATTTVGTAGAGQPQTNIMPYLGVNHVIALYGIFPSRN
jgi:microcystin-dependent protein